MESAQQAYLRKMYGDGKGSTSASSSSSTTTKKRRRRKDATMDNVPRKKILPSTKIVDEDALAMAPAKGLKRGMASFQREERERALKEQEDDSSEEDEEDKPIIVAEYDEQQPIREAIKASSEWVVVGDAKGAVLSSGSGQKSSIKQEQDFSPPRRSRRHDTPSPPRRGRHDTPSPTSHRDLSPPRRGRQDTPSPPRKRARHDTPSPTSQRDLSPPRRGRHDTPSPPRKRTRHDTPSPTRIAELQREREEQEEQDRESEMKRQESERKREQESAKPDKMSAISRAGLRAGLATRGDYDEQAKAFREGRMDNVRQMRQDRAEADEKDRAREREDRARREREQREREDQIETERRQRAIQMQRAQQQEEESEDDKKKKKKKKDDEPEVYYDKRGRKLDMLNEFMRQEESRRTGKPMEESESVMEWGKGEVKRTKVLSLAERLEAEKSKPFARSADDEDLNAYYKEQDRWGDPMARMLDKNKGDSNNKKKKKSKKERKKEKKRAKKQMEGLEWLRNANLPPCKFRPTPNRFNIPPGPRWDGIDRSNGFEVSMFKSQAAASYKEQLAFQWSVADM